MRAEKEVRVRLLEFLVLTFFIFVFVYTKFVNWVLVLDAWCLVACTDDRRVW